MAKLGRLFNIHVMTGFRFVYRQNICGPRFLFSQFRVLETGDRIAFRSIVAFGPCKPWVGRKGILACADDVGEQVRFN